MKNFILLFALLFVGIAAKCQVYLGGTLAFQVDTEFESDKVMAFGIAPEIGYRTGSSTSIGVSIPATFNNVGTPTNDMIMLKSFGILPYIRCDFAHASIVDFFCDFVIGWRYIDTREDELNCFELGLRPGLKINFGKKFMLVARTTLAGLDFTGKQTIFSFAINNGLELGCAYKF